MESLGRRPVMVAAVSVAIGVVIFVAKLVVGLLTGSLGIVSDSVHSLVDVVASGFALVAVRTARKPADTELLVITAVGIAFEALRRLTGEGAVVDPAWYAFALLVATLLVEAGRAGVLRRVGRLADSEALQADATNRLSDVISTVGVLAGLAGVRAGLSWADSAAALLVAVIIARAAVMLIWRSGDILIDRAPAGAEAKLREAILRVNGVREVRAVRVRRSGPTRSRRSRARSFPSSSSPCSSRARRDRATWSSASTPPRRATAASATCTTSPSSARATARCT